MTPESERAVHPRQESKQAFVICQLGDEGSTIRKRADELFDFIVFPVLKDAELEVLRSDKESTPGQITSQIVRSLLLSRVVIADLTGRNPNVYYELAIAHSFNVPVVILVDRPESLSFDTQNERVIAIGDDGTIGVGQAEEAKRKLRDTLKIVLEPTYKPASLVTEVANSASLADLAPENPEAAQLSSIKSRVDSIFNEVRRIRGAHAETLNYDLRVLTNFVHKLVSANRVTADELSALPESNTSDGFDNWIIELVDEVQGAADWGGFGEPPQGGFDDVRTARDRSATDWGQPPKDEGGF